MFLNASGVPRALFEISISADSYRFEDNAHLLHSSTIHPKIDSPLDPGSYSGLPSHQRELKVHFPIFAATHYISISNPKSHFG